MHPDYTIRPAQLDDVEALPQIELAAGALFESVGWETMTLDDVTPVADLRTAQQAGRLWVAVSPAGDPVGFAVASLVDGRAHLDEVDVHPDHARRGIGKALVAAVCEWARSASLPAITLTTERDIPWNAPFYARLGFEVLPPNAWGEGVRAIVADEAARGLKVETRVVMIRVLN